MAERNSPNGPFVIQANTHNAEVLRQMVQSLATSAGIVISTDMAITAQGTPNMTVNVAAGFAFLKGTEANRQGTYHVYNDATVIKTISASDPTNPRHDLIVAKVQDADFSGATNTWSLAVVAGTPNASPVDPATPNNAIVLAMVNVRAATASILNSDITDRRTLAAGLRSGVISAKGGGTNPGVDCNTVSASAVATNALHSVTVVVPASGSVRVDVSAVWACSAAQDAILYVKPGAGAYVAVTGFAFSSTSINFPTEGQIVLTGLTPGSMTFQLGFSVTAAATLSIPTNSRGAAATGTYIIVTTLP